MERNDPDGPRRFDIPERNETTAGALFDRHRGHDGNAQSGAHHAEDAAELAALEHDSRIHARALAGSDGRLAEAVPIAQQKERVVFQVAQRN